MVKRTICLIIPLKTSNLSPILWIFKTFDNKNHPHPNHLLKEINTPTTKSRLLINFKRNFSMKTLPLKLSLNKFQEIVNLSPLKTINNNNKLSISSNSSMKTLKIKSNWTTIIIAKSLFFTTSISLMNWKKPLITYKKPPSHKPGKKCKFLAKIKSAMAF